jgi:aryl-alcohol dehydrogenase-like predicted oxidoreductase
VDEGARQSQRGPHPHLNSSNRPGGLRADKIAAGFDASLKRLQTDYVDVYFSHWPDPETSHEETLGAYDPMVRAGKVRAVGASNYTADMVKAAHETSVIKSLPRYEVLQPKYNLYDRADFDALRETVVDNEMGTVVYYSLASGFLTGKYRSKADFGKSPRGGGIERYMDKKGTSILAALDKVAAANDATPAEVSLAWLVAQPGVTAPIASATSVEQVRSLAKGVRLKLSEEDLQVLTEAGQ